MNVYFFKDSLTCLNSKQSAAMLALVLNIWAGIYMVKNANTNDAQNRWKDKVNSQ